MSRRAEFPVPLRRHAACSAIAAVTAGVATPAGAHTAEQGFVLTLPTGLYLAGGTLAGAATVVLMAAAPILGARPARTLVLGRPPRRLGDAASLGAAGVLVVLIVVGVTGTQDPLANPLPLTVWTLWWVGLTAVTLVAGDPWPALNPWRGPRAMLCRLPGIGAGIARPPLAYPAWLGAWPAVVGLAAFGWFELIHTTPGNPTVLAWVVGAYAGFTMVGVVLFGAPWLRDAETFSVYFRMVAWLAPIGRGAADDGPLVLRLPGARLIGHAPLDLGRTAFVLLALATVSFDGLARSFAWLDLIGVNPLDFPGRSAVADANTAGLLGAFAALASAFVACVWLGRKLGGGAMPLAARLGADVTALVPIALGYHIAHYLPAFLVDAQYAAIAFGAPFGLGEARVTRSFLTDRDAVRLIWHVQVAVIVAAHVVAVAVGHAGALRRAPDRRTAIVGQLPLTALMIGYTLFGLWLLATPSIG